MNELEFFERFRPSSLEDIILPKRIRTIAEKGLVKNYIFYSSSGTGKTSLARILLNKHTHLIVDSKLGVDVLRDTIKKFCSSTSIFDENHDSTKVVYFEEFDRASKALQEELKSFTEKYSYIRFLATCNNISGFDPAIHSRFTIVDFTPSIDDIENLRVKHSKRIYDKLISNNINVDKQLIKTAIVKKYPDIRAVWNYIEVNIDNNIEQDVVYDETLYLNLFENLSDLQIWDYLYSNWIERYNLAFSLLGRQFIEYIRTNRTDLIDKIGASMKLVTEYTDIRLQQAPDPFLTLYSLYTSLRNLYIKK